MNPAQRPDAESQPPALPPLQSFRDVLAGRSANRDTPGVLWPDFDSQTHARLWRRGRAVCTRPEIDAAAPDIIDEPALFVSMYDNHFGHMVAETMPRLPQSLAEAPGLPLYFTADRPTEAARTSGMFRAVLGWLDVPLERVRFIHRPTLFRHLHVAAQGEHLDGPPPARGYLELLEARIAGRLAPARPEGITFVSRAGLGAQKGYHAGERYLVACLQELGVRIVYPEALPLPEQMRIYSESRHLVFSEGSAIHGRQLLGRVDQQISILRRRFRSHIAQHQLQPRCAGLTYAPCYGGALHVSGPEGRKITHAMASLYAIAPVIEHFETLGVPLRRIWDRAAYERARDADVLAWVAAMYRPDIEPWLSPRNADAALLDQFDPLGLGHLRAEAAARMRQRSAPRRVVVAPKPAPPRGDGLSGLVALRGERGVDLFTRSTDPGQNRARYRCIATWTGPGDGAALHRHEPAPGHSAAALAQAAAAASADPVLQRRFSLTDPAGWPQADPLLLAPHVDFLRAWLVADGAAQRFLARLESAAGLPDEPGALAAAVAPLYDFNRLALAVQVAPRLLPLLRHQPPGPGAANGTAYALRMLGDLCSRAGEDALALACHEAAIALSDNPHRRRKAIEAALALGDRAARDRHLAAYRRRWTLPDDLARRLTRQETR